MGKASLFVVKLLSAVNFVSYTTRDEQMGVANRSRLRQRLRMPQYHSCRSRGN